MKEFLPKDIHQDIALGLYGVAGVLAVLKKPVLLLGLVAAHLTEYLTISRPLAAEKKIPQVSALIHTLLYGFTWWKPIREEK